MHAMPATLLSAAVTFLSILFVFYTGVNVARFRAKHRIVAPAVTGNAEFDRAYRVQINTLEQFVMFLPLLWLATSYFTRLPWLPAALGLLWVTGRVLYLIGYMAAAEKRSTGMILTALATVGLIVLSAVGIVQAWMALGAA